jgi:general transcription factor IIIA
VNHEGRRDFVCPHDSCGRAFGYKHLLQRHVAKLHTTHDSPSDEDEGSSDESPLKFDIDKITGKGYRSQAAVQLSATQKLRCPYPDLRIILPDIPDSSAHSGHRQCDYVFSRAYDLHRHLTSEHAVDIEKNLVNAWVQEAKVAKARQS